MMEVHPTPSYYGPLAPSSPYRRQPRFGMVGEAVSAVVGQIDKNRLSELMASDALGMIWPRYEIAKALRGPSDARETAFRELSGLVGNTLLAGVLGIGAAYAIGNSVHPLLNPHGLPPKAWVSSENLEVFSKIYSHALGSTRNTADARNQLIRTILANLESGDQRLSIKARLSSLKKLDEKEQKEILRQMWKATPHKGGETLSISDALKQLKSGQRAKLEEQFLAAGWGKLSQESQDCLAGYYQLKPGLKDGIKGCIAFDERAEARIRKIESYLARGHKGFDDYAKRLKADRTALFRELRLEASKDYLRKEAKEFRKAIDQEALYRGLTGTVRINHSNFKTGEQPRSAVLNDLKNYLEQFVDRANYQARQQGPRGWEAQRHYIEDLLLKKAQNGPNAPNFLRRLLPHANDGLVTAALKSKTLYTWLPVAIAVSFGCTMSFVNNYITKKKNGGIFPGDEDLVKSLALNQNRMPAMPTVPYHPPALPFPPKILHPLPPGGPPYSPPMAPATSMPAFKASTFAPAFRQPPVFSSPYWIKPPIRTAGEAY